GPLKNDSSCPGLTGLTRASINLRKMHFLGWIAGSSPAMTSDVTTRWLHPDPRLPSPLVGEGARAKRGRVRGLSPRMQTPHPARTSSAPPSPTGGEGKEAHPHLIPNRVSPNSAFCVEGCERQYCGGASTWPPSSAAACQPQRGSYSMPRASATMSALPEATISSACCASVISPTAMVVTPVASLMACANGT